LLDRPRADNGETTRSLSCELATKRGSAAVGMDLVEHRAVRLKNDGPGDSFNLSAFGSADTPQSLCATSMFNDLEFDSKNHHADRCGRDR
jgi:hypothetical protein